MCWLSACSAVTLAGAAGAVQSLTVIHHRSELRKPSPTSPAHASLRIGQLSAQGLDSQAVGVAWDEIQEVQGALVFGDGTFVHHSAVLETGNKAER